MDRSMMTKTPLDPSQAQHPSFSSLLPTVQTTPPRQIAYPRRSASCIAAATPPPHPSTLSAPGVATTSERAFKRAKMTSLSFFSAPEEFRYKVPRGVAISSALCPPIVSSNDTEEDPVVYKVHYSQQPAMRSLAKRSRQLVRETSSVDVRESFLFPSKASISVSLCKCVPASRSFQQSKGLALGRCQAKSPDYVATSSSIEPLGPTSLSNVEISNRLWHRRGKYVASLTLKLNRPKRKQQV